MNGQFFLISDAAKEVKVESHVLRYWEEELHLPIKRNEQGHRYYTYDDVELFKHIKNMKERGLQLKAIKIILKNGKLDVLSNDEVGEEYLKMPVDIVENSSVSNQNSKITAQPEWNMEEKSQRLQFLMRQLINETLMENNERLVKEIKESVIKELDYQFRLQEEHQIDRENKVFERNDEYYKKIDELLRTKVKSKKSFVNVIKELFVKNKETQISK